MTNHYRLRPGAFTLSVSKLDMDRIKYVECFIGKKITIVRLDLIQCCSIKSHNRLVLKDYTGSKIWGDLSEITPVKQMN